MDKSARSRKFSSNSAMDLSTNSSARNRKPSPDSTKDTSTNNYQEKAKSQTSNSQPNDYKHFEKQSRTFAQKDFKETVQYHDKESYIAQRHHFVGSGLYNTDEIEDLPPRHRQKVSKYVNRVSDIVTVLSTKYPDDFDVSKNPEMKDILDLSKSFDVNKKLSDLATTKGQSPSKNNVHVPNRSKSNLNKNFNSQSNASSKNGSCKDEVSSNSSSHSRSRSRSDIDVRNDQSTTCEMTEDHFNKVRNVPSYLSRFPEDFDASKNLQTVKSDHSRHKSNCDNDARSSQSSPSKTSQISDKVPNRFHQPSHSKDPMVPQSKEKSSNTKVNRQICKNNKDFNCKSFRRSPVNSESYSNVSIDTEGDKSFTLPSKSANKCTRKDLNQPSHSRDIVHMHKLMEGKNSCSNTDKKKSGSNLLEDKSNCTNADKKKHSSYLSPKSATDSIESSRENLHHNSFRQKKSIHKSLEQSSEDILEHLKSGDKTIVAARSEKDYYVPIQNIKKTRESGFFIFVNVSDKCDNLKYWEEIFCSYLEHNRFSLEFCCKFSESLLLNFERKNDGLNALRILKKKKDASRNLREPHITLVSQRLRYYLTRPCDCSNSMFQNCKKYFKDFKEKFVKEHRKKIGEVQQEMKDLKNVRNQKHQEELHLSLREKLDVLEKMEIVFKGVVSMLDEKLSLHEKFAVQGTLTLKEKYVLKDEKFFEFTSEERAALRELLILEQEFEEGRVLLDKKRDTEHYLNSKVKLPSYSVSLAIRKLKKLFSYECNSFRRCLPVYSKKLELLDSIRQYSVLVISAETGSGKTTQLAEYLLQSTFVDRGTIICTQPRKIAAVSVANFVCGQIGTAVGKLVGYDIGTEKKYDSDTKIIYMTDYALLKKLLRNRKLRGVSCVIIDEAHERTLYTDLVLGMLKDCIRERLDLRLIVTSATIDPSLFVEHFGEHQTKVIQVPGRTYPVEVVWLEKNVEVGDNYVKQCVETALKIHQKKSAGNILVFLTSPAEIDEAIMMFKDCCSGPDLPELLCLHGKCDLQEQLLVFQANEDKRKVIFATNSAETSLTIPGVKYVIDSGRAKEMVFYPDKNKNVLLVDFINKSSAEQRKGRAGRTQPGVCFRMYSKKNYENMVDSPKPEILRTNLQKAVLKLYQFGLEPKIFSFVESPPKEALKKALESLEHLSLIKETKTGFSLTDLGKKVVEIPTEPHLAKLVLEGIKAEIGYETIIVAALLNEAGRLFFRTEDIKDVADERKRKFCKENGDLCTYLEVYKRWLEEARQERYNWCTKNYVNSKALNSATKTIQEILISLHQELGIRVSRRYNNHAFKSQFEKIVFNCFSENLCSFSGHAKLGYFSPHFPDSLYIHPSSSLSYLKANLPSFLVYSAFMQTSRNFLLDVTPIKEETIKQAVLEGTFQLHPDSLKGLQPLPKTLGPFGESVLIRHILGKKGSKINNLESLVERLTHCKNFQIDVCVEKGVIVIYLLKRYHETVARYIYEMVEEAHAAMREEEENVEIRDSLSFFCLGTGGLISDIIMPGEFKEVRVDNLLKLQFRAVEESLKSCGPLQSMQVNDIGKNSCRISATYVKVASAQKAMATLSQWKGLKVKANVHLPVHTEESYPIYKMEVKWCRCPATGKGWVEFYSESDCITASGGLTLSSFYINRNYIQFTPSNSERVLDMKNLPSSVDEETIKKELLKKLPDLIKVRNIYIVRNKAKPVTEKEVEYNKSELKKLFSTSVLIDLKYPNPDSYFWTAMVYFKKWEDGVKALNDLDGKAKIDSVPLQIKVIKESHLQCKAVIFEAIKKQLCYIEEKSKRTIKIFTKKIKNNTIADIRFSCKGMKELFDTHFEISQLLQGKIINCYSEEYSCLFTANSAKEIENIKKSTNTAIIVDSTRKEISIFGTKENRVKAHNEVCSIVTKKILAKRVVFNLSETPAGFLKFLYSKFGLDLGGLHYEFSLKSAKAKDGKLILEGTRSSLKRVEEYLERICSELFKKNSNAKSSEEKEASTDKEKEICAICLDPVTFDFHRLENCGHAFCRACLVLQIDSKTIPLCCIKEGCEKKFYIVDIKKLLSYASDDSQKNFYKAALHHHVTHNPGEIVYCPSPDCHSVYRVSSSETEQFCNGCKNVICTRCKSLYHYGMSCEFFQKSDGDEDFSYKMWMQEDENLRKQCPSCRTLIEKDSGCNHLECINCKAHFCWLCLKIFPTGLEVYDHLPYCPKNQTA